MANNKFKKFSAAFECRHCGRMTRDVNGSNGSVRLCEDCEDGCMQENGFMNSSGEEQVQYERDMKAAFQRAVNKGGVIDGYVRAA